MDRRPDRHDQSGVDHHGRAQGRDRHLHAKRIQPDREHGGEWLSHSCHYDNVPSERCGDLTAVPDTGWAFANWTGGLTGSINPQSLTIDGNTTVTATFTLIPPTCYTLTLSHMGQGSDPTASPVNSTGCSTGQYIAGQVITLSGAVPTAAGRSAVGPAHRITAARPAPTR